MPRKQGPVAFSAAAVPTEGGADDATLLIDAAGTVRCLYTEVIALAALGRLEVRRAATVEFDNDRQGWTVTFPDGRHLEGFATRTAALHAEQAVLTRSLFTIPRPARPSRTPGPAAGCDFP